MTTQNDDEQWINGRPDIGRGFSRDDMRAAIARGREQGRKDANGALASLNGEAHDALDAAGVEHAPTVFDRVRALIADRDRLAKRVQELEADIAADRKLVSDLERPSPARKRYDSLESRLAATDARLTALVEALHAYHKPDAPFGAYPELMARLAALRAPGDSPGVADYRKALQSQATRNEADALRSIHANCHAEKERCESALATLERAVIDATVGHRKRMGSVKAHTSRCPMCVAVDALLAARGKP